MWFYSKLGTKVSKRLYANVVLLSLKQSRVHLLDTEPFQDAFGPKGKRKRPKLLAADYESLLKKADKSHGMKYLNLSLANFDKQVSITVVFLSSVCLF